MKKRTSPVEGIRLYKMFSTDTKAVGDHAIEAIMSSETEDRDGDVIRAKGWVLDEFNKHPALLCDHNYGDITCQIGEWSDVKVVGNKLVGTAYYYVGRGNPKADWAYYIASLGKAAYSVGFIPLAWKDREEKNPKRPVGSYGYEFTKQELLETSQVTIPSNADAVQLAKLVSQSENFRPEFVEMAKDILHDMANGTLRNLHSEEDAKKLISKMEKGHMELCNCYAPDCGNMAAVSIPLCPDHLMDALQLLAAHDEVEEDAEDMMDDSAAQAVAGAKDATYIVRSVGDEGTEEREVVINAQSELLDGVDIKLEIKNAVKEVLMEYGVIKEVAEVEETEAVAETVDAEEVKTVDAEVDKGVEDNVEIKDLGEDSTSDGGALVEEVEEDEKKKDEDDSQEKSLEEFETIAKMAFEGMFSKGRN